MSVNIYSSPAWDKTKAKLSVLVPFYKDDPTDLIAALENQVSRKQVELILYDDGTQDDALTQRVRDAISASAFATQLWSNADNQGRAGARNALQDEARADWVLFLDSDMRPVRENFLENYLTLKDIEDIDIIFGGFVVEPKAEPDHELHRALSEVSDCLDLAERNAAGAQYVASSNLCIRKFILDVEGFDPEFHGWGWEDSEWAARATQSFNLLHADNPAIHLGLETTDTLLRRFATSGENYKRFTQKHPELAPGLNLFKASKTLGKLPGQSLMRPVLKHVVKTQSMPINLRLQALKLWRASHYAEAL